MTLMNVNTTNIFIDSEQLIQLTGRKNKSLQIAWLKTSGIAFRVNATGHPVVTILAIEGRMPEPLVEVGWTPQVIKFQKIA